MANKFSKKELDNARPGFIKDMTYAYYHDSILIAPGEKRFRYKNRKDWLIAWGLTSTQANTIVEAEKKSRQAAREERMRFRYSGSE